MDAHVFRRLCDALAPLLVGARLEKIQSPAPDVTVFTLYARQQKRHLVLRAGRRDPFLYISAQRPVVGVSPSAFIMRLRKYCGGRRVAACLPDWTGRRLSLLFQAPASSLPPDLADPASLPPETWLTLDLREGPQLLLGKSPDMSFPEDAVRWPSAEQLSAACEDWRQWPVLTPALRRTLPLLEVLDQAALLADLEYGGGDLFVYRDSLEREQEGASESVLKKGEMEILAWPLPFALCRERTEEAFEDPLEAVATLGGEAVLGAAADKVRSAAALPHEREAARLEKLLQKLEVEERRLRDMAAAQEQGRALQSVLWRYGAEARLSAVETDDATHPCVELDPRLTLSENMQALFHKAARGKRGLEYMVHRRETLAEQLRQVLEAARAAGLGMPVLLPDTLFKGSKKDSRSKGSSGGGPNPQSGQSAQGRWPKGVQPFRSSDGFLILRGRDAKGNGSLLRVASGHDLWLHVDGGPGSHALIRRAFAGQEIPERTLHEAASLAAVKSWQKDSPAAHILCAEARHVKPMRGATPGTVRIDKVALTFRVDIDQGVETALAL